MARIGSTVTGVFIVPHFIPHHKHRNKVVGLHGVAIGVMLASVSFIVWLYAFLAGGNAFIQPGHSICKHNLAHDFTVFARQIRTTASKPTTTAARREPPEVEYSNGDYPDDDYAARDDMDEEIPRSVKRSVRAEDRNDKEWMFFDVATINVHGGDGGNGCMAMQREFRLAFGGPCGGNGGDGGSVYLQCDERLNTLGLLRRRVQHRAKSGMNGKGDSRHGPKAGHVFVPVPPGTIVRDQAGAVVGELNSPGQTLLVARGGAGGRGNEHFKTARMNAPAFAEKGEPGQQRWLHVELKLVADVGLVGVPNAGKSTLLAASSNAKPKIADYPFTTVVPNLGVCDLFDADSSTGSGTSGSGKDAPGAAAAPASLVIADIPGLLEGAHAGVGMGTAFLRHIERCRVLVHVVDGSSADPLGDFKAIQQELCLFNPQLALKTQVVVVNKVDIPAVRAQLPQLVAQLRAEAGHSRVIGISAAAGENVKDLMRKVCRLVGAVNATAGADPTAGAPATEDGAGNEAEAEGEFEVQTDERFPGQFRVVGSSIEKVVSMTNWEYYEAVRRFQRILEAQGISAALRQAGAKQGDLVMVGDWDFNYWEPRNRWIAELGLEDVNPRRRPGAGDADGGGAGKGRRSTKWSRAQQNK